MIQSQWRRWMWAAATTATLVSSLALTGCANPTNFITGLTTGGRVSIGELPARFPSADVPIADGKIVYGSTTANGSTTEWTVVVYMSDQSDPIGDVSAAFTSKGFTATDLNAHGNRFGQYQNKQYDVVGGRAFGFDKGEYSVMVTIGRDNQNNTDAVYIVTQTPAS